MAAILSAAQQDAVSRRGGNLLVAAGAGSGKTTVLVERVLSLVCGDHATDIDRLLVLTFTNAAAAEMRARIEDGLSERLRAQVNDGQLMRQLALIQQAPITTIHSFCLDIVRRNFYRLGLDAGFRIPSEMERAILHEETLAAFMESEYEKEDARLTELADSYGGQRDDSALLLLVDDLYQFSRSQPHPEDWLKNRGQGAGNREQGTKDREQGTGDRRQGTGDRGQGIDDYAWSDFLLGELKLEMVVARFGLEQARLLAEMRDIPAAWLTCIMEEIAAVNRVLAAEGGFGGFLRALAALGFERLPAAKTGDTAAKEEFRCYRDDAKKDLRELQKRYTRRSVSAMAEDLRALAPLMRRLTELVIGFGAALDAEKRRRNLLDFDDMEHFCLSLLEEEDNGVAAELRASFDEVLIDEYQDINAVQERILNLLARGDNCFAVGDVKQSIYRFRLAEPTLFLHKYRTYGECCGGERIDLNLNYRSNVSVINAVNFLFRQLMGIDIAELDYGAAAELKAGRAEPGAAVELWLIERGEAMEAAADITEDAAEQTEDEAAADAPADDHNLAAEARLLGRRILELHAEGYAFRDMAVLLRATKNREGVMAREFASMGIPAVAAGRADYLQAPETGLMLSLLTVIDNPLQDIPLAAVLRSPLFGFTMDELAEIRQLTIDNGQWTIDNGQGIGGCRGEHCSLVIERESATDPPPQRQAVAAAPLAEGGPCGAYECAYNKNEDANLAPQGPRQPHGICHAAGGMGGTLPYTGEQPLLLHGVEAVALGYGDLAKKCHLFLTQIEAWRKSLRHCRVSELIWQIYRETGLYQLAGALPEGGQRQENLLLLYQRAREYEAGSYRGLFRFLLFLADGRGKSAGAGAELAEGEEAVRVMSIHRSKGLEFPVVFVANLSGAFSMMDMRRDIIWHKELGLGAKVVQRRERRKFPSLAHDAVARRLRKEALAEEMRVLYVALTRARERLILSASLKDAGKSAMAWYRQAAGQGSRLNGALLSQDRRPIDWLGKALIRHPDAAPLRDQAGIFANSTEEECELSAVGGQWRCHIIHQDELKPPAGGAADDLWNLTAGQCLPHTPEQAQVEAVLSYQYPHRAACDYAAKQTVTGLAKQLTIDNGQWTIHNGQFIMDGGEEAIQRSEDRGQGTGVGAEYMPPVGETPFSPMDEALRPSDEAPPHSTDEAVKPMSSLHPPASGFLPPERGTVYHKVLENLDYCLCSSAEDVAGQLRRFEGQGLLSAQEAGLIDVEKITAFAATPLIQRWINATRSLREAAFTYALPATELIPAAAPQDKLVLQGVIDAAFWDDDGWVLLDYKTGGHSRTEQQLKELYASQLNYYRRALADIWQEPVKEAWLCFIDLGKNIEVSI